MHDQDIQFFRNNPAIPFYVRDLADSERAKYLTECGMRVPLSHKMFVGRLSLATCYRALILEGDEGAIARLVATVRKLKTTLV